MEEKIRVGIVGYLNSRPLIYGLQHTAVKDRIELTEDTPARLAEMLQDDEIDVGLVPVAAIPQLPAYHIIGRHCIAADGPVASVALFSRVPLKEIKTILLDYQSKTSVALVKWLFEHYWEQQVTFEDTQNEDYISQINAGTAGVIIGDRALQQRQNFGYIYDLAANWKEATGLPFVFAAWVSTKELPQDFITMFDEANAYGLQHLDEIAGTYSNEVYDLKKYFSENLSYQLDEEKKKGLELFLKEISTDNF